LDTIYIALYIKRQKILKVLKDFPKKWFTYQDAAVLTALKTAQDAEKNHPTKTKYKDLFPSLT
jgi:hypothetical protein